MKQRNVLAVLIYSIITLGIYDLFWLASTKKELNARTKVHVPTLWLLFSPVLLLLAGIVIVFVASAHTSGMHTGSSAALNLLPFVFGIIGVLGTIVVPVYWFLKYSKAVSEYTQEGVSTAVAFLLLWLLRFIGMAIIQDKFNDMLAKGTAPSSGPVGPVPDPMAPVNPVPLAGPAAQPTVPPQSDQPGNTPQPPSSPNPPLVQ